jgi:hypothetical protein
VSVDRPREGTVVAAASSCSTAATPTGSRWTGAPNASDAIDEVLAVVRPFLSTE